MARWQPFVMGWKIGNAGWPSLRLTRLESSGFTQRCRRTLEASTGAEQNGSQDGAEPIALGFDAERQGIWASQEQIGAIFGVTVSSISRHIRNIFEDKELSAASNLQKVQIARSTKPVTVYSLDVVISVGYRVNSRVATRFRQWATQTLRTYVEQGYVLNDKVLREHPEQLNKLAADVRALRSSEKHIYAKVRECFHIAASDYSPSSQAVRSFYALLQDKFHHAVTGMTSSKLILDRADHYETDMGLQTIAGDMPTIEEAKVGKNYLRSDELYRLHLLCEQFLLFAEATALAGRPMTMKSLHDQLDRLLRLNDYPVFDGYRDYLRDEAVSHAKRELRLYERRGEIESQGMTYDLVALAHGHYDERLAPREDNDEPLPPYLADDDF
jgi:hypothetical protein